MTKILRGVMTLLGATAFLAVSAATAFAGDPYATGGGVKGESTGGGTLPPMWQPRCPRQDPPSSCGAWGRPSRRASRV